ELRKLSIEQALAFAAVRAVLGAVVFACLYGFTYWHAPNTTLLRALVDIAIISAGAALLLAIFPPIMFRLYRKHPKFTLITSCLTVFGLLLGVIALHVHDLYAEGGHSLGMLIVIFASVLLSIVLILSILVYAAIYAMMGLVRTMEFLV